MRETCTVTGFFHDPVGPYVGVTTQFSYAGELRDKGGRIANSDDEWLFSNITQYVIGYNVIPRFGIQLNLPVIYHDYRRREQRGLDGMATGDEFGLGDATVFARGTVFQHGDAGTSFNVALLAGVKLPTGETDFLRTEREGQDFSDTLNPDLRDIFLQTSGDGVMTPRHFAPGISSGVHDTRLALGSGSVDFLVGTQGVLIAHQMFATAMVQYVLRTEGAFDYQYANELIARSGPGCFLLSNSTYSLGIQLLASVESKGTDHFSERRVAGQLVPEQALSDTGITAVYLTPQIRFLMGNALNMHLGIDVPVMQNVSNLQIVPDGRVNAGILWQF